ncbi:MAG: N-acetyltransferase family protein [Candidatus Electrothrix sp. AR1]|nr:N-acetyltransferase family protein [Candidatus Electrothrix sp. AR1]
MNITLSSLHQESKKEVIDIFNHYINNSLSAYPDQAVPYEFFDIFEKSFAGYPAVTAQDETGEVVGFGLLRPYNPLPTFAQTAETTYFVAPEATGKGIGQYMLDHLTQEGKEMGLTTLLAHISSHNQGSINFHLKNGFTERGRLREVGKKNDTLFDVVYMQKMI